MKKVSNRGLVIILILIGSLFSIGVFVTTNSAFGHEGKYRVIMIPGWHGDGGIFKVMIPILESQGINVVDFDPSKPGTQALYHDASVPPGNLDIPALANQVEEKIHQIQSSPNEKFDIVAHSMGGLIARYLIEKGPEDPNIDDNWAQRIDDLIMLGTPNHGTWEAYVGRLSIFFGDWAASAAQMVPGSSFLNSLGYSEPAGEDYTCVGGSPWYLDWFKADYNGDGVKVGFDGVVPGDSPFLTGCNNFLFDAHHGELATKPQIIDLVAETLGYVAPNDGEDQIPLYGSISVRLEYFKMTGDHEWGTEEYYFDVYVDLDGGNDGYTYLGTLNYNADGPFTKNWGNSGPSTGQLILPGTSPRMDIRIDVREDNDLINVFYFHDIMLSEDVDGVDYYEDIAADPSGSGTNVLRISANGFTFDISQTYDVRVVFKQARIDNDGDFWNKGENYFKTWAGPQGKEIHYNHWAQWSGEDVYYIYDTYGPGSGYDALIYVGRMVKTGTLHIRIETWDDDGIGDDHLNADLDVTFAVSSAAGSYYWDRGDAAYWLEIRIS